MGHATAAGHRSEIGSGAPCHQILTIVLLFIVAAGGLHAVASHQKCRGRGQRSGRCAEVKLLEKHRSWLDELLCRAWPVGGTVGQCGREAKTVAEQALLVSNARGVALESGGTRMEQTKSWRLIMMGWMPCMTKLCTPWLHWMVFPLKQATVSTKNRCWGLICTRVLLAFESGNCMSGGICVSGRWRDLTGRWDSSRVAKEFGAADPALGEASEAAEIQDLNADPRMNDRWSAYTLASGVRSIQSAILGAKTAGRPPVAPSQSQLWSLALWHAYNSMPSTAGGTLDSTAVECVEGLIDDLVAQTESAQPGEPIIPDMVQVILEEVDGFLAPRRVVLGRATLYSWVRKHRYGLHRIWPT